MARTTRKLDALTVQRISTPGRHSDGAGLYLYVDKSGSRRWRFLFRWKGKLREMGLGPAGRDGVGLKEAREAAEAARAHLRAGRNPIDERRQSRDSPTFGKVADVFVATMKSRWRNEKHQAQWAMTLTSYAASLRDKAVDEITTDDVLAVLKPLWGEKPETASRLRGRIERVLDAAKASGYRTGENPARWRGHLDLLLPMRARLTRGHHRAMPFEDVPTFAGHLRIRGGMAAAALEFTILSAARTGETLGATWREIDFDRKIWTIPSERMKAGREHRVPLSERAVKILEHAKALRAGDYVFPGHKEGRPLSSMAMEMLLRRMKVDATVHGFRSSFRDWAGELTSFPREVAETALAHTVGDSTERAYRRGDALEKRRKLMEAWAAHCERAVCPVLPDGAEASDQRP